MTRVDSNVTCLTTGEWKKEKEKKKKKKKKEREKGTYECASWSKHVSRIHKYFKVDLLLIHPPSLNHQDDRLAPRCKLQRERERERERVKQKERGRE